MKIKQLKFWDLGINFEQKKKTHVEILKWEAANPTWDWVMRWLDKFEELAPEIDSPQDLGSNQTIKIPTSYTI